MRPQVISITGTGTTAWIPLDYKQNPFNVGFGVVVSGTVTYSIEHTFDNVLDSSVTPTAFNHETLVAQTANQDCNGRQVGKSAKRKGDDALSMG